MVFHPETNSNKHLVEISNYFKILRGLEIDFQPHSSTTTAKLDENRKYHFQCVSGELLKSNTSKAKLVKTI